MKINTVDARKAGSFDKSQCADWFGNLNILHLVWLRTGPVLSDGSDRCSNQG